ncbi:sulfotransferase 1B1-like [Biomphalaria glabrata]|uniref:Sulfotransferase 1B1-like n=1 Tax=Biomphalaria glabrata TaxID=6526 RepID=A0A9W2YIW3_BIOGL|nr:sulfotransferase 1B1-like [Biomphalaria glabrata]
MSNQASLDAPPEWMDDVPPLATLTDRFGNSFYFGNAGDFWFHPFRIGADNDFRTHVQDIRSMNIRDDDIMICSYPKTGLHWNMEIVKMLMDGSANMDNEVEARRCFLDSTRISSVSDRASPRLLLTHVPFRWLPKQALEKKIKIIFLNRNPKDTLVSLYHHMHSHKVPLNYPGTFEQFFHLFLEVGYIYGDLFDYLMEWQNGMEDNPDVPFYTCVFEEMKLNPEEAVKKLNQFLGTGCSEELCEQIADACNFTKMKQQKESTAPPIVNALFKGNKIAFYRKGEVGDWKNWFTVAMNEQFDQEYNKRMSNYKTVYKYTL